MFGSGIAFVLTHIDVDGELPFTLIDNYILRKARDNEIELIKNYLNQRYPSTEPFRGIPYEAIVKEEKRENGSSYSLEQLPRERWKYYVVAFDGTGVELRDLEYAAMLIKHDLEFGFDILFSDPNQGGRAMGTGGPIRPSETYYLDTHKNAQKVKLEELQKVQEYYDLYKKLPTDFAFISRAIRDLFYLHQHITRHSGFLVVGYFSIIESLITHAPRSTETLDSINHQVSNKIALLRKRFTREIPYSDYFLETKEEKLWKKLYEYRSCVAHGGNPDFKKQFPTLKSHKSIPAFLKEIIKELLICSMREPEFMSDLKKC